MVLEADDEVIGIAHYDHVASGHSAVAGWRPNSTYFCMCEQAGTPELYDDDLTKAQASNPIDEMREKANVT